MRTRLFVALMLACLGATAARLGNQMPTGHSSVEMSGVKPAMKLQKPLEGFMTPLNGKLDMRASEVDFEPGGTVKDHFHFGPGDSARARR